MPRLLKPPCRNYDLPFRFFTFIETGFFAFFSDSAAAGTPLSLTLPPRAVFFSAAVFGFPFPAPLPVWQMRMI